MEETKISFKTAKLAYEKGFDPKIKLGRNTHYLENSEELDKNPFGIQGSVCTMHYPASTQSLLQKWLREQHKIIATVYPFTKGDGIYSDIDEEEVVYNKLWSYVIHDKLKFTKDNIDFPIYEEAMEEALFNSLKLIKN